MISGIGVDIVDIHRLEASMNRYGERFANRVFTSAERTYCTHKANSAQHFAARFAGKEAFLKAAGVGLRDGISWQDMEFMNDELGKPNATYCGRLADYMEQQQVTQVHVSFSHTADNAVAVIVLERNSDHD